jgi:hypothetical protein
VVTRPSSETVKGRECQRWEQEGREEKGEPLTSMTVPLEGRSDSRYFSPYDLATGRDETEPAGVCCRVSGREGIRGKETEEGREGMQVRRAMVSSFSRLDRKRTPTPLISPRNAHRLSRQSLSEMRERRKGRLRCVHCEGGCGRLGAPAGNERKQHGDREVRRKGEGAEGRGG